jgi:hypothetical protein
MSVANLSKNASPFAAEQVTAKVSLGVVLCAGNLPNYLASNAVERIEIVDGNCHALHHCERHRLRLHTG